MEVKDTRNKWNTKKIQAVLKEFNETAVLPKLNPFYERNINLLKAGVDFSLTANEFKEMVKIRANILYYAETYAKTMTDYGHKLIKLRRYQKRALLQIFHFKNTIWLASRQIGKSLSPFTLLEIEFDNKIIKLPFFMVWYMINVPISWIDKFKFWIYYKIFLISYT